MPHGTPEWGHIGPKDTVFGLDDLGEQAVRLGSPHLFDRRGDVLVSTDFRNGTGVAEFFNAVALGGIGLWTGVSRQGAYSIGVTSTGANAGDQGIRVGVPFPVQTRIGGEATFSVTGFADCWKIQLYWRDRTREWHAAVRWCPLAQTLEYLNSLGGWTPFAAGVQGWPLFQLMNTMKLVVDMATQQYVRVIFCELPYSLAGIGVEDFAPSAWAAVRMWVLMERVAGSVADAYIDNVILTHNEP